MPTNPTTAQPKVTTYPNFGPYLTYAESVKSATAIRLGIVNVPPPEQYANMMRVYKEIYEPICKKFGKLPVSSFFRSPKLNSAVKGSKTSAHLLGLAIDIDCDGSSLTTNKALYQWVRQNLKYDQCIQEYPDRNGNPGWIHIGLRLDGKYRQQGMRAELRGEDTIYIYE
ncbi:D-Ala-D-Ala carboxypeptidase family metallohydrolase [Spirosoma daeguense]